MLSRTPGTWLHAEMNRWHFPASWPDLAGLFLANARANEGKSERDELVQPLKFPWDEPDIVERVSDEERAALTASLTARSAMRNLE